MDRERLLSADDDLANWLTHGRTWSEQRFATQTAINAGNVASLGLDWHFDLPTRRGIESTPLVVDGVMVVTASWSIVYALDARSGRELWHYDPGVPRITASKACCDAVNRGVAIWGDKVFVGTLDGDLVALRRQDGAVAWRVSTVDKNLPYTITGAPRVVEGKVIIGNGGAEYGVRGYVSAYDSDDGELSWRFYTVPGDPAKGHENEAMAAAAKTWNGQWWTMGGGGTVWDSMAYDPEAGLLYIGVGNGSPWNREVRSPGGGDNLFLSSIVALRAETGEYVWHYQTTPGDSWDYTATQSIILADLVIAGESRKVLMQAPKNGFFYMIDRLSGELVSAQNYVPVTWASQVDAASGRPVENPAARYVDAPSQLQPAPFGGHNWHPMSFSPLTGFAYFSAQEMTFTYGNDSDFKFTPGRWNTAVNESLADLPEDPLQVMQAAASMRGHLVAWDPVAQREAWRQQQAGAWNGGTLATAGNLVFSGNVIGEFAAYSADKGERLWSFDTQTGITAGPVSYQLDGEQYISVAVGWGTLLGMLGGPTVAPLQMANRSRVLTFRLNADGALPPVVPLAAERSPQVIDIGSSDAEVTAGRRIYVARCRNCHGFSAISGGLVPDLRMSSAEVHQRWNAIVLEGQLQPLGMPGFGDVLSGDDAEAVRAYVVDRARALHESPKTPFTGL